MIEHLEIAEKLYEAIQRPVDLYTRILQGFGHGSNTGEQRTYRVSRPYHCGYRIAGQAPSHFRHAAAYFQSIVLANVRILNPTERFTSKVSAAFSLTGRAST